jgi:hypothetical protein
MDDATRTEIEAAAFRALRHHLMTERPDVQNIDLMNLAGFCRNCIADWYALSGAPDAEPMDKVSARTAIYGMHPDQWKAQHQR